MFEEIREAGDSETPAIFLAQGTQVLNIEGASELPKAADFYFGKLKPILDGLLGGIGPDVDQVLTLRIMFSYCRTQSMVQLGKVIKAVHDEVLSASDNKTTLRVLWVESSDGSVKRAEEHINDLVVEIDTQFLEFILET